MQSHCAATRLNRLQVLLEQVQYVSELGTEPTWIYMQGWLEDQILHNRRSLTSGAL